MASCGVVVMRDVATGPGPAHVWLEAHVTGWWVSCAPIVARRRRQRRRERFAMVERRCRASVVAAAFALTAGLSTGVGTANAFAAFRQGSGAVKTCTPWLRTSPPAYPSCGDRGYSGENAATALMDDLFGKHVAVDLAPTDALSEHLLSSVQLSSRMARENIAAPNCTSSPNGTSLSFNDPARSEERRVGKECRSRW